MKRNELLDLLGKNYRIHSEKEKEQFKIDMHSHGFDPGSYYQELEMSSPYIDTHTDTDYSYENMSLHSHTFYEIICCRTNCSVEYLIGPYRYTLQKGDILLIRPGVSHKAVLPEHMTVPYERDILWINTDFVMHVMSFIGVTGYPDLSSHLLRTANTPWEYLCDMIHTGILEEERKQEAWQSAVLGNTILFLSHLRRAMLSRAALPLKAESTGLLDEIIAYLDDHYLERITMSDLAKHFFVSERTISSLFRQHLGITFWQFLTQRRLIAAKSLILEGYPMDTAAERAGFADYSTFYRAFRKEYGISPNAYKKQNMPK